MTNVTIAAFTTLALLLPTIAAAQDQPKITTDDISKTCVHLVIDAASYRFSAAHAALDKAATPESILAAENLGMLDLMLANAMGCNIPQIQPDAARIVANALRVDGEMK